MNPELANSLSKSVDQISIKDSQRIIDYYLKKAVNPAGDDYSQTVNQAMNYSLSNPSKRLRPLLVMAGYLLFQQEDITLGALVDRLKPYLYALEMIHTYSLIHDDLPAMDNADVRRGQPACHIRFGEAEAILAGDGLLNNAFEVLHRHLYQLAQVGDLSLLTKAIQSTMILSHCSGSHGMIGGQMADLYFEQHTLESLEQLDSIEERKTGALIRAGLQIGGLLACPTEKEVECLEQLAELGNRLGKSFQIQDDLLDRLSCQAELGKPVGTDLRNNKKTYLSFAGVEAAQIEVKRLLTECRQQLDQFNGKTRLLRMIIDYLEDRRY